MAMGDTSPTERVREIFDTADTIHGCAESTFIALQEHYDLPDPGDSTMAMALNGGVAYWGGTCGAITGAALAVGRLTGTRIEDHAVAKRVARRLIQRLMKDFHEEFGSLDCRDLTGYDMIADHDDFLTKSNWRVDCTRRLQYAVARVEGLIDPDRWEAAVAEVISSGEVGPATPRDASEEAESGPA